MYKNKKILAIIPARSGSKRIKNKNLKKINNKPLIHYTLEYALNNKKYIDKFFLSTDSKKISKYGNKLHHNISPILRPKSISKDKSGDIGFVKHALNYYRKKENMIFDIVVIFRPTTPIRKKNLFINCLKTLEKNNASSVRSAKSVKHIHPYWMYKIKNNKLTEVIRNKNFFKYYQSQKLPNFFMHDGHCDIFLTKNLLDKKNIRDMEKIYGKKMTYFKNKQEISINIDEPFDFFTARTFLEGFIK